MLQETAYYSKWMRTVRYAPSNPDFVISDIEQLNKSVYRPSSVSIRYLPWDSYTGN